MQQLVGSVSQLLLASAPASGSAGALALCKGLQERWAAYQALVAREHELGTEVTVEGHSQALVLLMQVLEVCGSAAVSAGLADQGELVAGGDGSRVLPFGYSSRGFLSSTGSTAPC